MHPYHDRHLDIHENDIESLPPNAFQGFQAVCCYRHLVTVFVEDSDCQLLVHAVVFCEQDAKGARMVRLRPGRQRVERRDQHVGQVNR